jgi:hypothetical protein
VLTVEQPASQGPRTNRSGAAFDAVRFMLDLEAVRGA